MKTACIAGVNTDVPGLLISSFACFWMNSIGDKARKVNDLLWLTVLKYFDLKYLMGSLMQTVIEGCSMPI